MTNIMTNQLFLLNQLLFLKMRNLIAGGLLWLTSLCIGLAKACIRLAKALSFKPALTARTAMDGSYGDGSR